jgi:hypothetical protein
MHKKVWWALGLITILGLLLRLYYNTHISLWHDEAFSALLIHYSWPEMMHRIGLDVHPPMYYIFLRGWSNLFGDSLLALRGLSILFGVGTILATFGLAKSIFQNIRIALIAALFVAINPFQLQYVSEARMYTMGAFFALLAAWFLYKALQPQAGKTAKSLSHKHAWYYIGFIIASSISILTHYYLLFTIAALCLFGLLYIVVVHRLDFKKYLGFVISCICIGISFLPWLPTFLYQYRQVAADYWIPKMDQWSIPLTIWRLTVGLGVDITKSTAQVWAMLITVVVLVVIAYFLRRAKPAGKWLVVFAFLAPFAGSLLFLGLSYLRCHPFGGLEAIENCKVNSVFLERYFLYAASFLSIILAASVEFIRNKKLAYTLVVLYAALGVGVFFHYWTDIKIREKSGMTTAAHFLHANMAPTDKIYVGSSFEFFNLKYYAQTHGSKICSNAPALVRFIPCQPDTGLPVKPLLFSGGNTTIKSMPHYAGTAILTDQDLLPYFDQEVDSGDTVWLLWTTGFGGSKPSVPSNWEEANEEGYADVRPYVGTWIIVTEYRVK